MDRHLEGLRPPTLQIDVNALYDTVARSMAFKGKEAEHKAAVQRVGEVTYTAVRNYRDALEGT